jgi:hypothetical protein
MRKAVISMHNIFLPYAKRFGVACQQKPTQHPSFSALPTSRDRLSSVPLPSAYSLSAQLSVVTLPIAAVKPGLKEKVETNFGNQSLSGETQEKQTCTIIINYWICMYLKNGYVPANVEERLLLPIFA